VGLSLEGGAPVALKVPPSLIRPLIVALLIFFCSTIFTLAFTATDYTIFRKLILESKLSAGLYQETSNFNHSLDCIPKLVLIILDFMEDCAQESIDKQDLQVVGSLGKGCQAEVYLVRHAETGQYFAVKVVSTECLSPKENERVEF
jgi:hypothetical protein